MNRSVRLTSEHPPASAALSPMIFPQALLELTLLALSLPLPAHTHTHTHTHARLRFCSPSRRGRNRPPTSHKNRNPPYSSPFHTTPSLSPLFPHVSRSLRSPFKDASGRRRTAARTSALCTEPSPGLTGCRRSSSGRQRMLQHLRSHNAHDKTNPPQCVHPIDSFTHVNSRGPPETPECSACDSAAGATRLSFICPRTRP